MSTRREFIQQVGIALASMMMAGCTRSQDIGQLFSRSTPTPECPPFEAQGDSPRERLRSCWQAFGWLISPAGGNCCSEAEGQLVSAHRAALDELTAADQLDQAVADEIDAAFGAATVHIRMTNCRIVCYEAVITPAYSATSQFVHRAKLLDKIAVDGDLDPDTVAEAQGNIERYMVFLDAYPDRVTTRREDGSTLEYEQLDLEITPEAAEAAAFLTRLLAGQ